MTTWVLISALLGAIIVNEEWPGGAWAGALTGCILWFANWNAEGCPSWTLSDYTGLAIVLAPLVFILTVVVLDRWRLHRASRKTKV